mgnify:CR=1 FL=1
MTNSEIEEVMCWGTHVDVIKGNSDRQQAIEISKAAINQEEDTGIVINGRFTMQNGISTNVFGTATPYGGIDVWSNSSLIRWNWGPPQISAIASGKNYQQKIPAPILRPKARSFSYRAGQAP